MQGTRSSKLGDGSNNNGDDEDDDDDNKIRGDDDGEEKVVQRFLCAKVALPCVHWQ